MLLPEVLFTGSGDAIYVADYATVHLAAADAAGKRLIFPSNQTYAVTSALTIPGGCYVEGNGSTIKFPDNSTTTTTSDWSVVTTGSNVTFDNLRFDGNVQNQGGVWSQHRHNLRISGSASNVTVKGCTFVNMIGDGIYISTTGSNIDVILGNTFTANSSARNRNGVSIIEGRDVTVDGNTFTDCARGGMPGAIDVEPNSPSQTIDNIVITNNTVTHANFSDGTMWGIIAWLGANPASGIEIANNNISGSGLTSGVLVGGPKGGPFSSATGLHVHDNNIHDLNPDYSIGVELDYWTGVTIENNTITNVQYGISNYQACILSSTGNTFTGIGNNHIVNDNPHCS
ncbi:right-handed parallel beta-helix repeat-containing protein [Streptomyces sp. NPDC006458]|uniref:right-handed parallel beta-helix repeat-containing protein n=1 Tax=Streptomyces sp. NPDC006458 TaxID=3154302 RepID=UPI0033BBB546